MTAPELQRQLSIDKLPPNSTLATIEYRCTGSSSQSEPLVLVHGWGCDSRIWDSLIPSLSKHFHVMTIDLPGFGQSPDIAGFDSRQAVSLNSYLDALLAVLPARSTLVGWSLGGMLATQLAGRNPERFNGLITLASNASFVQKDDWPWAMNKQTFDGFYQLFQQQPALCLKRFYGLQCQGDRDERSLLKALKGAVGDSFENCVSVDPHTSWLRGLQLLAHIDNRQVIASLEIPGLHLYGGEDHLVPAASAGPLRELNPLQQSCILEQQAHIPQLSCPDELLKRLLGFLAKIKGRPELGRRKKNVEGLSHYHLDKKRVAESFSRAAQSYDSVARLQRQVGQRLLDSLPEKLPGDRVIDLGCGTGYFTDRLAKKYSSIELIGLDLAQGMLAFAGTERQTKVHWLCADAEALPLADQSVDLIFSNLAIQWCEQLPTLAAEINRVLKPGGYFAFTSLGGDTLYQLRASWAEVDNYVHVNRFTPAENYRKAFEDIGMNFHQFDIDRCDLEYRDLRHLTDELKGLGAHNLNSGQNRGLTGPRQIRKLIQSYEKYRHQSGTLPATWEVIYGVASRNV
jgi:malonyl-CoA O-methyltransferase